MRFRLKDTPQDTGRYAYSYLGAIIAAAIAGLATLIVNPIVGTRQICQDDQFGACNFALTAIIILIVLFAAFFLIAFLLRLGWQWAAWLMAGSLILIELIIEFSTFAPLWFLLILPALAALLSYKRPPTPPPPKKTSSGRRTSQPTKVASRLRLIVLGLAFFQFVIWFILLLVS